MSCPARFHVALNCWIMYNKSAFSSSEEYSVTFTRHVLLRRLDPFDCRKLAMYMLSNGKKILLLFCELFLQFHNNLHLGCNAADFYDYSMTFYMKDKPKCVIPLIIPECFK